MGQSRKLLLAISMLAILSSTSAKTEKSLLLPKDVTFSPEDVISMYTSSLMAPRVRECKPAYADWANAGAGALLGTSISLSSNTNNKCLNGISGISQSLYLVYYYMNDYQTT